MSSVQQPLSSTAVLICFKIQAILHSFWYQPAPNMFCFPFYQQPSLLVFFSPFHCDPYFWRWNIGFLFSFLWAVIINVPPSNISASTIHFLSSVINRLNSLTGSRSEVHIFFNSPCVVPHWNENETMKRLNYDLSNNKTPYHVWIVYIEVEIMFAAWSRSLQLHHMPIRKELFYYSEALFFCFFLT